MGNGPPASNVRYKAQNRPGGIHNSTVNNQHCSSFLTKKMTVMTVLVLFLVATIPSLVQVLIVNYIISQKTVQINAINFSKRNPS